MESAYRHCEASVRAADKDRFLATLFAPADRRNALFALYAFDGEIATVRDRAREPMPGEIRLQWWRDVLAGERAGEAAANPVAAALLDTIARFALPTEPLLDLIEAHAFDLYDDPMPTWAALEAYARKTGSKLFGEAARIVVGNHQASLDLAAGHAGVAYTLVALLKSFARHAARHQVYVPTELYDRHGARIEDIYAGQAPPALHSALAELREEARRHFAAFEALLPQLPPVAMPAFLPVALVPGYLAAMEQSGYEPFRTAIELPQWRRQWALWRAARHYARTMRG
jgi:15-cis-phytoene synthase